MAIVQSLSGLASAMNRSRHRKAKGGLADPFVKDRVAKINSALKQMGAACFIVQSTKRTSKNSEAFELKWKKWTGVTYDSSFPNVGPTNEKQVRAYLYKTFGISFKELFNTPAAAVKTAAQTVKYRKEAEAEKEAKKLAKSTPKAKMPKAVKEKAVKAVKAVKEKKVKEVKAKAVKAVKTITPSTPAKTIQKKVKAVVAPIVGIVAPAKVAKIKEEVKQTMTEVKDKEITKPEAVKEIVQEVKSAPVAAPAGGNSEFDELKAMMMAAMKD